MEEGKHVTWMPSYGAEVRGGTAHSMVIVSDEEIASPAVFTPDIAVVMNQPSLDKFSLKIRDGGTMFINSSLVKLGPGEKSFNAVEIPATEGAHKLGNVRCANMIMMGALVKKIGLVSLGQLSESLGKVLPAHRRNLLPLNQAALKNGSELPADGS